jgi:peroxiredoxin
VEPAAVQPGRKGTKSFDHGRHGGKKLMKINLVTKRIILLLAIVLNVIFLCLLMYEVIQTPPIWFEWMIPSTVGVFLIVNITALVLCRSEHDEKSRSILLGLFGNSKIRLAVMMVLLLVCMGLGFWMGFKSHDQIEMWGQEHERSVKVAKFMGKKVPDVVGKTLDGKNWKLREQTGKVVLLEFWATWCGPCVSSVPEMKKIYEKYKSRNDFVIVGVSLDDKKEKLVEFCKEHELPWIQLFDEGKGWNSSIAKAFENRGIPSCWIIDKQGNVAGMDIHSSLREEIEQIIERSLGDSNRTPD